MNTTQIVENMLDSLVKEFVPKLFKKSEYLFVQGQTIMIDYYSPELNKYILIDPTASLVNLVADHAGQEALMVVSSNTGIENYEVIKKEFEKWKSSVPVLRSNNSNSKLSNKDKRGVSVISNSKEDLLHAHLNNIPDPPSAKNDFNVTENTKTVPKKDAEQEVNVIDFEPLSTPLVAQDDQHTMEEDGLEQGEELNDLIGRPPGWILKSGISLIFICSVVALVLSNLISYPDKITATGVITTQTPPFSIINVGQTKRVASILVNDGELVREGDEIVYLNNTAKRSDVEELMSWVKDNKDNLSSYDVPKDLKVGKFQDLYAQIVLKWKEYQEIRSFDVPQKQIYSIEQEQNSIDQLNQTIASEEVFYNEELRLLKSEYNRAQHLHSEGIISTQELETAEGKYNGFLRRKLAIKNSEIQNEIKNQHLTLEKHRISEERQSNLNKYRFAISELMMKIELQYISWKEENFLVSDIDGSLHYHQDMAVGLTVPQGMIIGYVVPDNENNAKYIKVQAPINGIGKLKETSKANIKIHAYPYKEYGFVQTSGNTVSVLPHKGKDDDEYYQVKILLPDDIRTNYDFSIPYKPDMSATVEIITDPKTILGRIFEQIIDLSN